jgi:hypothetical protein
MHNFSFEARKEFFTAAVGATSALTGLVFVALSINLLRILSVLGLSVCVGEASVLPDGSLGVGMFTAWILLIEVVR